MSRGVGGSLEGREAELGSASFFDPVQFACGRAFRVYLLEFGGDSKACLGKLEHFETGGKVN